MISAAELIYNAAMKTPTVALANNKTAEYTPLEYGNLSGTCWLCGAETTQGIPKKKAIKPTFTDADCAKSPLNDLVCEHCNWALSWRTLRNYSILATQEGLQHPTRPELREILLNPPEPPFLLCIATSGQKWLYFKAKVSFRRQNYPVMLEEVPVTVNTELLAKVLKPVETLYGSGFSKAEILSGEYKPVNINKFGMRRWEDAENQITKYRGTRMFELAVFVAQKGEN